jgi:hypothetical protein
VDALLYLHAQSIFGDVPETKDEPEDPEFIDLGYPLALAFDLWLAWKDGHVMARRGGYLDQPRRWQKLIRAMNRRFNRAYERARDEHVPPDPRDRGDDGDVLEDLLGGMPFSDGAKPSWEQFKGSG